MLILLSGNSGVGKNTVIKHILNNNSNFKFLKNLTTRSPRETEKDFAPYEFVSVEEFENKIKENAFFEYERIHTNYYGTLKQSLNEIITSKEHYLKDIGIEGQRNLKKKLKDKIKVVTIFLTAPRNILVDRLEKRGEKDIELRLSVMDKENACQSEYDYVIENLDLEKTIDTILKIVKDNENNWHICLNFIKLCL